jgi:DNA-binding protein HU-beta
MAQVQLPHRFGVIICVKLYAKSVKNMLRIFLTDLKTFAKLLSKALDDCHRCCSIDSVLGIDAALRTKAILIAILKNYFLISSEIGATSVNKGELVDAIAEKVSVSKKNIELIVTAALESIVDAVAEGDRVTLVGFGSFEPRDRQEREGRNPRTGEKMVIAATRVPAFSAGKQFKEKVVE